MGKSMKQRTDERNAADLARDLRDGSVFAAHWSVDGLQYVRRVQTLAEATTLRDSILANLVRPLQADNYERQGHLQHIKVWVDRYDGVRWVRIEGSELTGTGTFTYAD